MAGSPDVIVELAINPCPPQKIQDDITKLVMGVFPLAPTATAVCAGNTRITPSSSVLSIGLWISAGAATDAELVQALSAASFISGNHTAALFVSTPMIQLMAAAGWARKTKHSGRVTLNNTIEVTVGSAGIVTKATGSYDVPVLPDLGFSDTITETLALNPPGSIPALQAHGSTHLDVSQSGIIGDSVLIGLISPLVGGMALLGGEVGEITLSTVNPQSPGIGASLAAEWPTVVLTTQPSVGKVTFAWNNLVVDASGVRTLGSYATGPRSPKVSIAGPTAITFPRSRGSDVGTYTAQLTDLRAENAVIAWSGAAQGSTPAVRVTFERAGAFHIHAKVTDTDNVSATGSTTVLVNVTGKGETP
jgi:hypothetical protein